MTKSSNSQIDLYQFYSAIKYEAFNDFSATELEEFATNIRKQKIKGFFRARLHEDNLDLLVKMMKFIDFTKEPGIKLFLLEVLEDILETLNGSLEKLKQLFNTEEIKTIFKKLIEENSYHLRGPIEAKVRSHARNIKEKLELKW
ncbi:MAG: hypothetical protein ACTSSG_12900 [Candidatus Heimdallarchaeaceae archaeon]